MEPRGFRRWLVRLLAPALVLMALVVAAADASFLADLHREEVLRRPTPPIGRYSYAANAEAIRVVVWSLCVAIAAAVPAALVLGWCGRRAAVKLPLIVAAAAMSGILVGLNGGRVQSFLIPTTAAFGEFDWDGLFLTPIVEELLMLLATATVLIAVAPRTMRAGLVLGAAAGLGMTAFETAHYAVIGFLLETGASLPLTLAIRFALAGLGLHATTAAITGAALGGWLGRRRRRSGLLLAAAVGGAVLTHAVWNLSGTQLLIQILKRLGASAGPPPPELAFLASSLAAAVLLAIPAVVLVVVWRRGSLGPVGEAPDPTGATMPAPADREVPPGDAERPAADGSDDAVEGRVPA